MNWVDDFTIRHGHRLGSILSLVVYHVPDLTLINYTTCYPTKLGDLADSSSNAGCADVVVLVLSGWQRNVMIQLPCELGKSR